LAKPDEFVWLFPAVRLALPSVVALNLIVARVSPAAALRSVSLTNTEKNAACSPERLTMELLPAAWENETSSRNTEVYASAVWEATPSDVLPRNW